MTYSVFKYSLHNYELTVMICVCVAGAYVYFGLIITYLKAVLHGQMRNDFSSLFSCTLSVALIGMFCKNACRSKQHGALSMTARSFLNKTPC